MSRRQALLIVLTLWAAIYLPGLGTQELKGEEGRRILPAATMLDSGNWIVPYVGGKPYLRKPPGLNWLIAGSFAATGVRTEWTARLPSVLAVLALALAIVALSSGGAWLSPEGSLTAATLWLTQISTIEKGRLAEIEALYTVLGGGAILLWVACWTRRASPWAIWIPAGVLLGLGLLAKGPLHLLFFYATVAAILWRARDWRALLHPAHGVALLVMVGIFAAWAIPYLQTPEAAEALQVWQSQFTGRVGGAFDWVGWITNIPRGLSNHLPWLLLLPLACRRELWAQMEERPRAALQGMLIAAGLCFVGLLLIPGVLPRYTLPLSVPLALSLALALNHPTVLPWPGALRTWWHANSTLGGLLVLGAVAAPCVHIFGRIRQLSDMGHRHPDQGSMLTWPLIASALALALAVAVLQGRRAFVRPALISTASGMIVGAAVLASSTAATPWLQIRAKLPPLAATLDRLVHLQPPLILYDIEYQPLAFYLETPIQYAPHMEQIPPDARWLLTREEKRKKLQRDQIAWQVVQEFPDEKLILLERIKTPAAKGAPSPEKR